ncbi:MAG TPA: polymer-forming cytoskeletal protein [Stellaceae bacterium]|nr:polymer-forming cytoskeletal protein [Stellaceae bacterium]
MTDSTDGLDTSKPLSGSLARPAGTIAAAKPAPAPTPSGTPAAATPVTTPLAPPRPFDTPARRIGEGHMIPTPKRDTEQRRLIVGREISLTGEITSCDRLIVEGSVEANLNNCREVEIAETGLLKGTAAIDDAEIRGRFEGTLTVRKRLLIRATGKITGTVRYGQLEVECGGQISGDIQAQPSSAEETEQRPPRTVVPMPAEMKL